MSFIFTDNDKIQISKKNISEDQINQQITDFTHGFPFINLVRAATEDDGIVILSESKVDIKPGGWLPNGYSQKKHLALKKFNEKYYNKKLPLESEDMQFDNLYYRGRADTKYIYDTKKIAVRWLRLTFGLSDSAIFDSALENAVTAFQITKGLTADGKVGDNTIDALMLTEEGQKWFNYVQNRVARRKY